MSRPLPTGLWQAKWSKEGHAGIRVGHTACMLATDMHGQMWTGADPGKVLWHSSLSVLSIPHAAVAAGPEVVAAAAQHRPARTKAQRPCCCCCAARLMPPSACSTTHVLVSCTACAHAGTAGPDPVAYVHARPRLHDARAYDCCSHRHSAGNRALPVDRHAPARPRQCEVIGPKVIRMQLAGGPRLHRAGSACHAHAALS